MHLTSTALRHARWLAAFPCLLISLRRRPPPQRLAGRVAAESGAPASMSTFVTTGDGLGDVGRARLYSGLAASLRRRA